ncbi:MAG: hypothetical protein K2H97_02675, partial [Prevotella sp.]|nr:hypothetical protein [Prevotella sp.]
MAKLQIKSDDSKPFGRIISNYRPSKFFPTFFRPYATLCETVLHKGISLFFEYFFRPLMVGFFLEIILGIRNDACEAAFTVAMQGNARHEKNEKKMLKAPPSEPLTPL